jgi:hypothetical protein
MQNGRCRLHGGLSTGPKTPEGRHRIRLALFKHGRYTMEAKQEQQAWRELMRASRGLLHGLSRQQTEMRRAPRKSPLNSHRCGDKPLKPRADNTSALLLTEQKPIN